MTTEKFTDKDNNTQHTQDKRPKWIIPVVTLSILTLMTLTTYNMTKYEAPTDKEQLQQQRREEQTTKETNYKEQFDAQKGLTEKQKEAQQTYTPPKVNNATGGLQSGEVQHYNDKDPQGVLALDLERYVVKDFNTAVNKTGFNIIVGYVPNTVNVTQLNATAQDILDNDIKATISIVDASKNSNQEQYLTYMSAQGFFASVTPLDHIAVIIVHNGVYFDQVVKSDEKQGFTVQVIQNILEEVSRRVN